ncbi:MAG: HlyD family efflux transporter periplasmic adaptor subunit, partial [Planctomycetaceae bacterium]
PGMSSTSASGNVRIAGATPDHRPSIARAATAVTGALVLSVAVTAIIADFTAEQFPGTLMTNSTPVTAPVNGQLEMTAVTAGEIVLPNHQMFLITDGSLQQQIDAAQQRVTRLESQINSAQTAALIHSGQQMALIQSDIFETELKLADFIRRHFHHRFEVTAWTDYLDPKDALAGTVIPPINLESVLLRDNHDSGEARIRAIIAHATAENEVESLEAKITLCERRLKTLEQSQKLTIQTAEAAVGLTALREQLQVARADQSAVEALPFEHEVNAPGFGMTGLIRHQCGDTVEQGDVLVEVFDRDDEFILVDFPSRKAPQLHPGTRIQLVFPGPEKREGKIEDVPPQVTSPAGREQIESQIAVRIIPVGRVWPTLPVGTTVYASFK